MERTAAQTLEATYSASWIDRIIAMIDRSPISAWLVYTIVLIGTVLLNNAIFWIDGGLSFGSFDPDLSIFAIYPLYWLAFYHYLNRQASRALQRFRPLLSVDDSEFNLIDFKLVNLPRNLGLAALLLGVVIAISDASGNLVASIGPLADSARTLLPAVYYSLGNAFIGATFFAFFLRTIRQLRLVATLHEQACGINLLALEAPHAFSGLTARAGLGLILLLILIVVPAPWQFEQLAEVTALELFFYCVVALLAVAVFVLPLGGMHGRLQKERDIALSELDELYKSAQERLYRDVRNSNYEEMGRTKEAISALMIHRERLDKTSTWPWDPRTIRGFTSALLLPIFLLLVAQLLERLF